MSRRWTGHGLARKNITECRRWLLGVHFSLVLYY